MPQEQEDQEREQTVLNKSHLCDKLYVKGKTMNIGIIGSGNLGSGLGSLWAKKGHKIIFSYSRNLDKLNALAADNPGAKTGTPAEAVKNSEVIILSVKWENIHDALKAAGPMNGKILIDCTNPVSPDMSSLSIGHTTSGAEEVAKMVTGARVVQAFNTLCADVYHSDSRLFGSRRPTMFYCGDEPQAKSVVFDLINELGLEPVAMLMLQIGYLQGSGTNIAISLIRR